MTARSTKGWAWACVLAALGCIIAAALNFGKGDSASGWVFVAVLAGFITLAIALTCSERKKRGEEMRQIHG